jgi:hypothetical protein
MSADTPDEVTVAQAAAVAKLYSLAVLDDVHTAVGRFAVELVAIKQRYERELSPGPDQFRILLAAAKRMENPDGAP